MGGSDTSPGVKTEVAVDETTDERGPFSGGGTREVGAIFRTEDYDERHAAFNFDALRLINVVKEAVEGCGDEQVSHQVILDAVEAEMLKQLIEAQIVDRTIIDNDELGKPIRTLVHALALNGLHKTKRWVMDQGMSELSYKGEGDLGVYHLVRHEVLDDFRILGLMSTILLVRNCVEAFHAEYEVQVERSAWRKKLKAVTERAFTDGLTKVWTRAGFIDKLPAYVESQSGKELGVMMMDADKFKDVNDTYGHDAGDAVLRRVGEILNDLGLGLLGRWGGEEFVVVHALDEGETAGAVGEKIRVAMEEGLKITAVKDGEPVEIAKTVSIGSMTVLADNFDLDRDMKIADKAMYDAKNGGRNRVVASDGLVEDDYDGSITRSSSRA